jgi:hypothetical protein
LKYQLLVMAGRSRPKDGVAFACLCPAIHVFLVELSEVVDARDIWREDALRAFARA